MVTIQQYLKGARVTKKHKKKCPKLLGCPQKRGYCEKVFITKPKKPNSAKRKTVTVILNNGKRLIAYIPGQGHNVTKNMDVLVRGGRVPDLPGVKYHIFRRKVDFMAAERITRSNKRSKYGLKLIRKEEYTSSEAIEATEVSEDITV